MAHMSHNDTSRIPSSVSFDALLRYNELETQRWRDWFIKQPDAVLDLAAGDPKTEMATTRDLLFHIFMVEWVFAKVLNGEAWENEWQKFDRKTREGIFAVAEEAQPKLRAFAESASAAQLARNYAITSRGDQTVRGTGVKFLTHVVFHSTRHWAQMAMLMRQQGHTTGWHHDLVLSDAME
jgi:uncharacterized damage-inducible protein DinB